MTTTNEDAGLLTDEQIHDIENDQAKMPRTTRDNLTIRTVRAALIAQHGFCSDTDQCTCAREIGYRVCQPPSPSKVQVEAANTGIIAAAEALIAADRVCALTDEHVNALENAIAIQRGNLALPVAEQVEAVRATTDVDEAQEPVAWTSAERLETLKRDGSRARTMWGADLAGPCDVPLYAASIRRDFATIPSKETIARLFIKHGGPVPDEGWCLNESGLNDFLGELFPDAAAASGGEKENAK
jgi:hypothetical protein